MTHSTSNWENPGRSECAIKETTANNGKMPVKGSTAFQVQLQKFTTEITVEFWGPKLRSRLVYWALSCYISLTVL